MKYLIAILAILLTGCSTVVPVVAKFPDAPSSVALQPCPDLTKLAEGAKLSDVSKTITVNYTLYYDCAVKADSWIEWYKKQQIIFEGIK